METRLRGKSQNQLYGSFSSSKEERRSRSTSKSSSKSASRSPSRSPSKSPSRSPKVHSVSNAANEENFAQADFTPKARRSLHPISASDSSTYFSETATTPAVSTELKDSPSLAVKRWMTAAKLSLLKHSVSIFIVMAITIAIIIFKPQLIYPPPKEIAQPKHSIEDIKRLSESFFPPQSNRFWKIITSSVRSATNPKGSGRPSCILFTTDSESMTTAQGVNSLADVIEGIFDSGKALSIYGADHRGAGHRTAVDEELSDWFGGGNKVAVLHDIDMFTVETAKLFYKFCDDNPGPVFPGSVLLLTVSYKPGYTLDKYWLGNVLRDHWSNEEDVVGPLLSRIGNSFNVIQSANTTETQ
ncbi:hypothetical protein EB796_003432 [Bugula neritina]|uniref:Torsin-1A-interacting protein 1/2 AAA+ activator domain-containing protein n=1 Tax=Bugula neritina TaxID=10212 RepID=A0A7J7KJY0_BUGNE|nr:hypothetical protein EB796_003432 [Bugula neritina]